MARNRVVSYKMISNIVAVVGYNLLHFYVSTFLYFKLYSYNLLYNLATPYSIA